MKKIIIATAVAFALSSPFAFAQSGHPQYAHGSRMSEQPEATAGWSYPMHGNNAALGGDNANSGSGENSATDGAFSSAG
jgi:hypothetical protein